MPEKALCIVPTIVQLELSRWVWRELGEGPADQVMAYTMKCQAAPWTPQPLCWQLTCTANTSWPR